MVDTGSGGSRPNMGGHSKYFKIIDRSTFDSNNHRVRNRNFSRKNKKTDDKDIGVNYVGGYYSI